MKKFKLLYTFIIQQALSCIFPIAIFGILALTKKINVPFIPRYDLIFILCLLVQYGMIRFKLETFKEFKLSLIFHFIGLILEIYKTKIGSWTYPEFSYLKIDNVPVYSGFMYSSVASYVIQSYFRLKLNFVNWPKKITTILVALVIYGNVFTNHFDYDIRWYIILGIFLIFRKCYVEYHLRNIKFKMPVIFSYLFISFFIWLAENISTFLGAWKYPNQKLSWSMVSTSKITSWFLLVIISIIIVVNYFKNKENKLNINRAV